MAANVKEALRQEREKKDLEDVALEKVKKHSIAKIRQQQDRMTDDVTLLPSKVTDITRELEQKQKEIDKAGEDEIRLKTANSELTELLKNISYTTDDICLKFKNFKDIVDMQKKKGEGGRWEELKLVPLGNLDKIDMTKGQFMNTVASIETLFIQHLSQMLKLVDMMDQAGVAKTVTYTTPPPYKAVSNPINHMTMHVERNNATKKRKFAEARPKKDCCRCDTDKGSCDGVRCKSCFAVGKACSSGCSCGGPDGKNCDNPNNYGIDDSADSVIG